MAAFIFYSSFQRNWNKRLLIAWPVGLALIGLIMHGGKFLLDFRRWKPKNGAVFL